MRAPQPTRVSVARARSVRRASHLLARSACRCTSFHSLSMRRNTSVTRIRISIGAALEAGFTASSTSPPRDELEANLHAVSHSERSAQRTERGQAQVRLSQRELARDHDFIRLDAIAHRHGD